MSTSTFTAARAESPIQRRLRFVFGVLAVLGAAWLAFAAVEALTRGDSSENRLPRGVFCTVNDFMASNIFAPTACYVVDEEYQHHPGLDFEGHLVASEVDPETLVIVRHDDADPAVIRGQKGRRDVDGRGVSVQFVSGPLTGRQGLIARYKLVRKRFD